jgi:hypothetical protein
MVTTGNLAYIRRERERNLEFGYRNIYVETRKEEGGRLAAQLAREQQNLRLPSIIYLLPFQIMEKAKSATTRRE